MEENKNPNTEEETVVVPAEETEPAVPTAEDSTSPATPEETATPAEEEYFDPFRRVKKQPKQVPDMRYGSYGQPVPPPMPAEEGNVPVDETSAAEPVETPAEENQAPVQNSDPPQENGELPPPPYPAYPAYPAYRMTEKKPSNGMAVASMILGILAVTMGVSMGMGLIFGVMAIIFALVSRTGEPRRMDGMAKTGFICGICGVVLGVIMALLFVLLCVLFLIGILTEGTPDGYDQFYDIVSFMMYRLK